jgi:hypothetical protein
MFFLCLEELSSLACSYYECYRELAGLLGSDTSPSKGRSITETSMTRVPFELMMSMFKRTKTLHVLDRSAIYVTSIKGESVDIGVFVSV